MHEYVAPLLEEYRTGRLGRRAFVRRALLLGVSAPALGALLAACAPASPATPSSPTAAPTSAAAPISAGAAAPTGAAVAPTAAAAAPPTVGPPRRGGVLRLTTSPVVNLDPHRLTSGGGIAVVRPSVNYLVRVDATGN